MISSLLQKEKGRIQSHFRTSQFIVENAEATTKKENERGIERDDPLQFSGGTKLSVNCKHYYSASMKRDAR